MSHLGDLIVEHGPYEGDVLVDRGPFADPRYKLARQGELNALRDELIELREIARIFEPDLSEIRKPFHDVKPDWHLEQMRAKAAATRPASTESAQETSPGGTDTPSGPQSGSAGCDCGHDGLDPMFHLAPCPIAEQRRRERVERCPCGVPLGPHDGPGESEHHSAWLNDGTQRWGE